jgi:hypothetical protein
MGISAGLLPQEPRRQAVKSTIFSSPNFSVCLLVVCVEFLFVEHLSNMAKHDPAIALLSNLLLRSVSGGRDFRNDNSAVHVRA